MNAVLNLPTPELATQAQEALRLLKTGGRRSKLVRVLAGKEGHEVAVQVPREAFELFTTQQAADMLNVSRPFLVGLCEVERRDGVNLKGTPVPFNASFIFGGQIKGESPRLFRTYAETNFIEAERGTPFLQTGKTKYGKPILDRVINESTILTDASKCVLLSFDSTMRSNLSVGVPIDLICYRRDSFDASARRRFDPGDPYFARLSQE